VLHAHKHTLSAAYPSIQSVKNEIFYRIFGQVLVCSVLILAICSIYWTFHGLAEFFEAFINAQMSLLLALAGIAVLIIVARLRASYALFLILIIAGLDRFLADHQSFELLNRVLAYLCFLLATITGVGIASEHFTLIKKVLPQFLMAFLTVFFLLPVGIIAKFANLIFSLGARRVKNHR
jgi:hypothetical protein